MEVCEKTIWRAEPPRGNSAWKRRDVHHTLPNTKTAQIYHLGHMDEHLPSTMNGLLSILTNMLVVSVLIYINDFLSVHSVITDQ